MENEVVRVFGNNDLGANTLLILGNGFDLDLGMRTRYTDFSKSNHWPFKNRKCGLGGYLNRHKNTEKWFDLEAEMARYCESISLLPRCLSTKRNQRDEKDDQLLTESLRKYLLEEFYRIHNGKDYNKKSVAARILHIVCSSLVPGTIYTFNYTDLKTIAGGLDSRLAVSCNPIYLHGEIKEDSIILGFNEGQRISDFYRRFCKSHRRCYKSTHIFNAIEKYDNIIFFGLSFGEIDNMYFADFFKKIWNNELNEKYIRIITKDENSRQSVLNNIQKMVGSTVALYGMANFAVLTNDGKMDDAITELYKHLAGD